MVWARGKTCWFLTKAKCCFKAHGSFNGASIAVGSLRYLPITCTCFSEGTGVCSIDCGVPWDERGTVVWLRAGQRFFWENFLNWKSGFWKKSPAAAMALRPPCQERECHHGGEPDEGDLPVVWVGSMRCCWEELVRIEVSWILTLFAKNSIRQLPSSNPIQCLFWTLAFAWFLSQYF